MKHQLKTLTRRSKNNSDKDNAKKTKKKKGVPIRIPTQSSHRNFENKEKKQRHHSDNNHRNNRNNTKNNGCSAPSQHDDNFESDEELEVPYALSFTMNSRDKTKSKNKTIGFDDGGDGNGDDDGSDGSLLGGGISARKSTKPVEPLRPGDVIEYTSPAFVAGSRQGQRRATVWSTDPSRSRFPIGLSNGELLPPDTFIRRVCEYIRGQLHPHAGVFRSISNFRISKRSLSKQQSSLVDGLLKQAERLRSARDKIQQDAMQAFNNSAANDDEINDNKKLSSKKSKKRKRGGGVDSDSDSDDSELLKEMSEALHNSKTIKPLPSYLADAVLTNRKSPGLALKKHNCSVNREYCDESSDDPSSSSDNDDVDDIVNNHRAVARNKTHQHYEMEDNTGRTGSTKEIKSKKRKKKSKKCKNYNVHSTTHKKAHRKAVMNSCSDSVGDEDDTLDVSVFKSRANRKSSRSYQQEISHRVASMEASCISNSVISD